MSHTPCAPAPCLPAPVFDIQLLMGHGSVALSPGVCGGLLWLRAAVHTPLLRHGASQGLCGPAHRALSLCPDTT